MRALSSGIDAESERSGRREAAVAAARLWKQRKVREIFSHEKKRGRSEIGGSKPRIALGLPPGKKGSRVARVGRSARSARLTGTVRPTLKSRFDRRLSALLFGFVIATFGQSAVAAAEVISPPAKPAFAVPGPQGWRFDELRRFAAAEAKQGVAADGEFLYVISDRAIGKYRAATGARVASWAEAEDGPIIHLNAGIVRDGKLYCAHSNYPAVPMLSSIEVWDTATLRHVASHSLGRTDGSLTWIDRREGKWVACLVHYGKKGGEPGRGPEWTQLVEFDDDWRRTGGWALPAELIERLSSRGYSCSGGAFGPGGWLFATGHDNPELYVLSFPDGGTVLHWTATIPITAEGQAFGWDPREPGVIYFVHRPGEVIVGKISTSSR